MLQAECRTRDLAMFNLAIDSKLRGCDLVAITVDDIAPNGYAIDRATVRQKKTGRPVRFELTEHTRQAVDDYLKVSQKKPAAGTMVIGAITLIGSSMPSTLGQPSGPHAIRCFNSAGRDRPTAIGSARTPSWRCPCFRRV